MRALLKPICIFITALVLCLASEHGFAQKKKTSARSTRDSIRQNILKRESVIRSLKHTGDASLDDLLGKIQDYTSLYTQINSELSKGYDTLDITQRLPTIEKRMDVMKKTLDNSGTMGYLIVIRNMVDRVTNQTKEWERTLSEYSDRLDTIQADLARFKKDSVLHSAPDDIMLLDKYAFQVIELEHKWDRIDSCAKVATVKIGLLQNRVSSLSIKMIDLNDKVDIRIHQFTLKATGNESGFIWAMHPQKAPTDSAVVQTYRLNYRLYKYFLTGRSNYWGHIASVALLLLFFAWIYNSKRKIARTKTADSKSIFSQTRYIVKHPLAATLVVTTVLSPFFYDHPPQILVQTMLLIAMAVIGILIKSAWPKPLFRLWAVLFVSALLFSLSDLMIVITHIDRILLLILSAAGIYFGFRFLKYPKRTPENYPPFMELALKAFIALNGIAVILNIAGRFSLAKIIGCSATFNLCLGMGMYLLIQILMESLFVQLEANKTVDQSLTSYLDFKVLQKKFRDVVVNVSIVLWLVTLAKNLAIDDYIYDEAKEFLNDPHTFSSTAFTFGNILIFIIIIWISGLIARVISYFYDFAGQQTRLTPQAKKTRSSILLIRLAVFTIGFFIAINAAGIPMDKVTLVIGALGVGIGFGLQNIVNNLVSGIILAFEKPVQVGDIIEVSGRSGTITEIGIRSSKIDCGNGSELIVPNGDLISQHVVNWTLSNNNRQVELIVRVDYGSDVDKVQEILKSIIEGQEEIMRTPAPAVYLNNFSDSAIDFKLLFWAEDIGKWTSLKSQVMSKIYTKFAEEGIEIPHGKNDIQFNLPDSMNLKEPLKSSAPITPKPAKKSKAPKENPLDPDQ